MDNKTIEIEIVQDENLPVLPKSDNPVLLYLGRLAKSGRRPVVSRLKALARIFSGGRTEDYLNFPWTRLRMVDLEKLLVLLRDQETSLPTIRLSMSAIKGVLKKAFVIGQYPAEEWARIKEMDAVRGSRKPSGRYIKDDEVRAIFASCESSTNAGRRDRAIISVLYATGLRRAEVANIQISDVDLDDRTIRYIGKGNKQQDAFLPPWAVRYLEEWIDCRGETAGPLFHPVNKADNITRKRGLSDQAIYTILKKRWLMAGIRKCSPHDFRRTNITNIIDLEGVRAAQESIGHADINTTVRYDRSEINRGKRGVDRLPDIGLD